MKRSLIGSVDLKPQMKSEQSVVVEYFRTEEEEFDDNYNQKRPFGIEVIKKQEIDGIVYRETKAVKHIGNSTDKVDRLLKLLCKNSVTPICVGDVLEDLNAI